MKLYKITMQYITGKQAGLVFSFDSNLTFDIYEKHKDKVGTYHVINIKNTS